MKYVVFIQHIKSLKYKEADNWQIWKISSSKHTDLLHNLNTMNWCYFY